VLERPPGMPQRAALYHREGASAEEEMDVTGPRWLPQLGSGAQLEIAQQRPPGFLTEGWALVSFRVRSPLRFVAIFAFGRFRGTAAAASSFQPDWETLLSNAIITLTTDYGTDDHLVGTVKGVILKINPDVTIVDISHRVAPFDLLDGALTIGSAYSYFPPKTIHVVIVDPGVGTDRRPLLVSGQNQYFIAPDNGVLSVIYEREQNVVVRHANAEHYYLQPLSKTFHGRDVFGPVAAWLSKSYQTAGMGEEIQEYKKFALPRPKPWDGGTKGPGLKGVVLRIDFFGNLITNFREEDVQDAIAEGGTINMETGTHEVTQLVQTFAHGKPGVPIAYFGSCGYLEIAINKANASKTLGVGRGAAVFLAKKR
jgi:S-adenosyl-L-methionine hydrolase (adenosine-forming)